MNRCHSVLSTLALCVAVAILARGPLSEPTRAQPPSLNPGTDVEPPAAPAASYQQLLELAGWDRARLADLADGGRLTPAREMELAKLLQRLRRLGVLSLREWARSDVASGELVAAPEEYQGTLLRLRGRVQSVEHHELPAETAESLEMAAGYYLCELSLDPAGTAVTLFADRVPPAWLEMETLDESAEATGLLLATSEEFLGRTSHGLVVAPALAWYPDRVKPPHVSFGHTMLASLGFDVSLLADIENRRPLESPERKAFYEMLFAAGLCSIDELSQAANANLTDITRAWQAEAARLEATRPPDDPRRVLAAEVLRRAAEGQYSVAPLFNDADRQVGNLVMFEGTCRRAVRVDVGGAGESGSASDIPPGIDHYYEVDLFTADSQDYPIVCCLAALPEGFPTGEGIRERVRVPGFFFKSWQYRTRKGGIDGEAGGGERELEPLGRAQLAPLIIGPGLVRLGEPAPLLPAWAGWLGGGLFAVALLGVWIAAWRAGRGDRAFRRKILGRQYSLGEGEALDEVVGDGGR